MMLSAVRPPYPLTDPPQLRGQLALPRPPLARPRRPGGLVCPHRQLRAPLRALSIHRRRLPARVVLGGCRRLCAAVGRAVRRRRCSHFAGGHGLQICVGSPGIAASFQCDCHRAAASLDLHSRRSAMRRCLRHRRPKNHQHSRRRRRPEHMRAVQTRRRPPPSRLGSVGAHHNDPSRVNRHSRLGPAGSNLLQEPGP